MKESIRSIIHNDKCVLLINGQLAADMPPQVARQLAAALIQQAQLIDNEQRQRDNLQDQAILMRAGVPINIAASRSTLKEAHNMAQWDRDLRRYMRNAPGIESREVFGLPTIRGGAQ